MCAPLRFDLQWAINFANRIHRRRTRTMNRRELCVAMPFLALATSWAANDQTLTSTTFPFDELQKKEADGHTTRPVVNGKLSTGEHVEVDRKSTRLNSSHVSI